MIPPFHSPSTSTSAVGTSTKKTSSSRTVIESHDSQKSIRHPVPSIAILTLLSAILPNSANAANPLLYLCPRLICPDFSLDGTSSSPPSSSRSSLKTKRSSPDKSRSSSHKRKTAHNLPSKYIMGEDGRWRLDTAWSLHGQTFSCSYVTPTPTPSTSSATDTDSPASLDPVEPIMNNGIPEISPTPTIASSVQSPSAPGDLPPGWADPKPRSSFYKVPVIVVFSLSLTLFITLLIASCALMRRKRRLRQLTLKVDADAQIEEGPEEDEDPNFAIQIKKQKRAWARTTARWRSNARIAMRRRRPTKAVPSIRVDVPMVSLQAESSGTSTGYSPANTNQLEPECSVRAPTEPTREQEHDDAPPTPESSRNSPYMPPAYPLESSASAQDETGIHERLADNEMPGRDDKGISGNLELDSDSPSPNLRIPSGAPVESRTTGHHIATDDKSVLARMADLASAPDLSATVETSTVPVPHAPEWLDEIPEDLEEVESDPQDSMFLPLPGPHVEAIHDGLSVSDTGPMHFDDASDSQLVPSEPQEETDVHPTASAPPMEEDCFPSIPQASIRQGDNGSHRRSLPIYEP